MIRPLFASEKLLAPPYMGCGISSDWHGTMLATLNEAGQNKWARQKGQAARRADLKRGWAAFRAGFDENGWVDRDDIPRIHAAMFPTLPQPRAVAVPPAQFWAWLDGEYALSVAIQPGAVSASDAIRRYVGAVPHQVLAYQRRTRDGTDEVRIVDPMHAPSDVYAGHWVRWDSLRKCGMNVLGADGLMLAFRFPVGGWTQARLTAARINEKHAQEVATLKAEQAAARERWRARERELEEQLAEQDCTPAVIAAYDQAIEAIEALKTDVTT